MWLRKPRDADAEVKRDPHNPDLERRAAPLCGLRALGGFQPDGEGRWRDGWIHNADNGKTYQSRLTLEGGDRREVRGCVPLPLFGGSQTWGRVEEPPGGCGRRLPG